MFSRLVFPLCALGCLAAGVYHAIGLVRPEWLVYQPPWRHALFVAINIALAAGFLWRPPFFPWLFAILAAEQIYGHGTRAIEIWNAERRVDWPSIPVLAGVPIMLVLLFVDRYGKKAQPSGPDSSRPTPRAESAQRS